MAQAESNILINDLAARISAHRVGIQAAMERVLASGWVVLGPEVRAFEARFAEYLGASHCVSLANGTDAIELGLRALGVEAGDVVACVANAGAYTSTALRALGAAPMYLDVDPTTYNLTLAEVKRALAAGVKAVVATHLYGAVIGEIEAIAHACRAQGVILFEDCAQAHGARLNGQCAGTFGAAASFSFYPTKNLGALGDGGAVVTGSAAVAEQVSRLRQYGWQGKYRIETGGARNSRLDELQAAVLLEFLPGLDGANQRRREIAAQYCAGIQNPALALPSAEGESYVAHLYVVRCRQRDALRAHLAQQGIASDVHYPIPDYRQPLWAQEPSSVACPHTDELASQVLTLPCFPEMTPAQVQRVIDGVNQWQP